MHLLYGNKVAENIISAIENFSNSKTPLHLLITFNAEDVRKQAAASTQRFLEGILYSCFPPSFLFFSISLYFVTVALPGKPVSVLDGIFMAIKDDIDCLPYPTKGNPEIIFSLSQ